MDMRVWLSRNRGFAGILLGMLLIALHVTISRLIDLDEEGSARLDALEAKEQGREGKADAKGTGAAASA